MYGGGRGKRKRERGRIVRNCSSEGSRERQRGLQLKRGSWEDDLWTDLNLTELTMERKESDVKEE
jgi:hypothetical protein